MSGSKIYWGFIIFSVVTSCVLSCHQKETSKIPNGQISNAPKVPEQHMLLANKGAPFKKPEGAFDATNQLLSAKGVQTFIESNEDQALKAVAYYVVKDVLVAVDYSLIEGVPGSNTLKELLAGYTHTADHSRSLLNPSFVVTETNVEVWTQQNSKVCAFLVHGERLSRLVFYRPEMINEETILPGTDSIPKDMLDRARRAIESQKQSKLHPSK